MNTLNISNHLQQNLLGKMDHIVHFWGHIHILVALSKLLVMLLNQRGQIMLH